MTTVGQLVILREAARLDEDPEEVATMKEEPARCSYMLNATIELTFGRRFRFNVSWRMTIPCCCPRYSSRNTTQASRNNLTSSDAYYCQQHCL